jgi:hypothetical protein
MMMTAVMGEIVRASEPFNFMLQESARRQAAADC